MTSLQLLLPLALLVSLWQILRLRRSGARRSWRDFVGLAALFLICSPVAAWLFAASLEHSYPPSRFPAGEAEAIVVLSGNVYDANPSQPETEPGSSTYLRAAHAAWLFHNWKPLPIVVSGGRIAGQPITLAGLMRRQLLEEGVPDSMIWTEDRSASTYENAVNTAALLRPKGIHRVALVTEGFHLRRSELCLRKQGLETTVAGCAYRTFEPRSLVGFLLPNVWGLRVNEECVHEWAGLIWYKMKGRI